MKAQHCLRPLLASLALSLSFLPLHAQQPENADHETQTATAQIPAEVLRTVGGGKAVLIPSAHFEGANLGEVVDYLAERSGSNLMISPEIKALPVPDMNLRNVTGLGVLRAIAEMGVPFQVTEMEPETGDGAPVWVIVASSVVQEPQTNVTRIFNLRAVQFPTPIGTEDSAATAPLKPELFDVLVKDISEAINVALQAREEATKGKSHFPVLKIHPATRLMVVSGNPPEVEIAQQVICALGGMPVE